MFRHRHFLLSAVLAIVMLYMLTIPGFAQTTSGRISGVVKDKETGEPLPGTNVLLVGTTYGAASDVNGEFYIQNIPVGVYTLQATFVGYATMRIENIRVRIGLTERVTVNMTPSVLQGQEITIIGERPLIEKTSTNTTRILNTEQIENLPIRGVTAAAALNPGVVTQDGVYYIRGSRGDAVGYYVEGVNTRDVVGSSGAFGISSASNMATVIPEALEEVQMQAGGYTAQYGGASGGIIASVLKSGTPDYRFSLRLETDQLATPGEKFLDTYSYGYSDYVLTASGPVPYTNKKVKFFVAGENRFDRDQSRNFWEPFTLEHNKTVLQDGQIMQLVDSGLLGGNGDTVQVLDWKGGIIPWNNQRNRYNYNGVLTYDLSKSITLRGSAIGSYIRWSGNGDPLSNLLRRERSSINEQSQMTLTTKMTHFLSPNAFYTLSLAHSGFRGKSYDPLFKDDAWSYVDSLAQAKAGFPNAFARYAQPAYALSIYDFAFAAPERPWITSLNYFKRSYVGGNLDFTVKTNRHNLTFGGEMQYWTMRSYAAPTTASSHLYLRNNPGILLNPAALEQYFISLAPNIYGYDVFGKETDGGPFFNKTPHPLIGAAYLHDIYEYKDLVINSGLRLDYYDMQTWEPKDYTNPGYDRQNNVLMESAYDKVKASVTVSPRLGFSFPVTDRTKFHFQWGKYIMMPQMTQVYRSMWNRAMNIGASGNFFTNPFAFRIDPERTTSYEVGFNQQFADNASFDVTLFYKDIKDQLQTQRVFTSPESGVQPYDITTNGGFSTSKGVEFRYTMRRVNRVMGWVNYTYQTARGTGSYVNQSSAALDQGTRQITIITPTYFNHPHSGNINLDYRFDKDDGGPILERLGLNLLFKFSSGHPYTLSGGALGQVDAQSGAAGNGSDARSRRPLEPIGSSMTPWTFYLDGRLDKTISIGKFDVNVYIYAQNLLNTKNILNVWPRTGSDIDGFLADPSLSGLKLASETGSGYKMMLQKFNDLNGQNWTIAGYPGDLWGQPREIRVGLYINY